MQLAAQILAKYAPSLVPSFNNGDTNIVYGLGVGWTFAYALGKAGKNPTRATLVKAVENLNTKANPFLAKGIVLKTGAHDAFPIEQIQMIKWNGGATGDWQTTGAVLSGIR
jgi:hypothetical protein